MSDEYTVCAAAFLRNKGKNIISDNEFLMSISMDLHWVPYSSAKNLLNALLERKIFVKSGGVLKPTFDIASVEVPVAYRPSQAFVATLKTPVPAAPAPAESVPEKPVREEPKKETSASTDDPLQTMIAEAEKLGMDKRTFISESNSLSKKLNIDMLAAGLVVIRDLGGDIDTLADRIYDIIARR